LIETLIHSDQISIPGDCYCFHIEYEDDLTDIYNDRLQSDETVEDAEIFRKPVKETIASLNLMKSNQSNAWKQLHETKTVCQRCSKTISKCNNCITDCVCIHECTGSNPDSVEENFAGLDELFTQMINVFSADNKSAMLALDTLMLIVTDSMNETGKQPDSESDKYFTTHNQMCY